MTVVDVMRLMRHGTLLLATGLIGLLAATEFVRTPYAAFDSSTTRSAWRS